MATTKKSKDTFINLKARVNVTTGEMYASKSALRIAGYTPSDKAKTLVVDGFTNKDGVKASEYTVYSIDGMKPLVKDVKTSKATSKDTASDALKLARIEALTTMLAKTKAGTKDAKAYQAALNQLML